MKNLIYYFDLGNTRGKLWRVCDGRVEASWAAPHRGDVAALLGQLPSGFNEPAARVLGLSVLGCDADLSFARAVSEKWGVEAIFARAAACFSGLRSAYKENPESLGVDRWLGMIGVDGCRDVLCVVGCGTAITIDVLSNGTHLGGYILPGLALMGRSLQQGTRQVRFDRTDVSGLELGVTTAGAVTNGALAAIVALIERTVFEAQADQVVLTGGDAPIVAPLLKCKVVVEPELLLKGMMRYFEQELGSPE